MENGCAPSGVLLYYRLLKHKGWFHRLVLWSDRREGKSMAEDKKARLEAIRAANRARQAESGDAPPAAPVAPAATDAPAPAAVASQAAVGASMPDDKKARLEAIRAANAAKKADAGSTATVVATPAAAQTTPAATTTAAPAATATPAAAPKPAARPAAAQTEPIPDDRVPAAVLLRRVIIGAVAGLLLCLMLATMTGNYLQGAFWGLLMGAVFGPLVLGWPPRQTTSD